MRACTCLGCFDVFLMYVATHAGSSLYVRLTAVKKRYSSINDSPYFNIYIYICIHLLNLVHEVRHLLENDRFISRESPKDKHRELFFCFLL